MKKMLILFTVLSLAASTLACKALTGELATQTPAPQDFPTLSNTAVEQVSPTQPPAPEVVPTPLPEIQPTDLPQEPAPQATLKLTTNTETPPIPEVGSESWRVQPIPGATLIVSDSTTNISQDWLDIMEKQARNLSIPKGYFFEIYTLPKETTYDDVKKHYNNLITGNGMIKAQDFVDSKGIGVLTWIATVRRTQKYLVQFNPGETVNYMFIIYSNPK